MTDNSIPSTAFDIAAKERMRVAIRDLQHNG
jgi:hypothetical protein